MHNRKKPEREATDGEKQVLKDKAHVYKSLVTILWEKRKAQDHSPETLAVLSKLLTSNPDFYSLWNFRREVLLSLHPDLSTLAVDHKLDLPEVRETELTLTAAAIRRNPKSYGAWHHRLWVVDRFQIDFTAELSLCRDFLKEDQRNFHCWNYRRAIFQRSGLENSHEMDYCLDKIQENFSNYSAFHHRSIFIKQTNMSIEDVFETEWPMVENAIFTEPDDQSAWWYYQFLVTLATSSVTAESTSNHMAWLVQTLTKHMDVIQSLLELEANSRWPLMILVFLADTLLSSTCKAHLASDQSGQLLELRVGLLDKLCIIDPNHLHRYRFLLNKVL